MIRHRHMTRHHRRRSLAAPPRPGQRCTAPFGARMAAQAVAQGAGALLLCGALALAGAAAPGVATAAAQRVPSAQWPTLGAALQAAKPGDRLLVAPGVYHERLTIVRPVTIAPAETGGAVIVDGGGEGRVIEIRAPHVTLHGLTVRNSGDDIEATDACIYVQEQAQDVTLSGNTLGECLFGIWVNGANGARITGNNVSGLYKPIASDRGNGIHLWRVRDALVRGNLVHDARDGIYISVSTASRVEANLMTRVRFGVHYMYNDNNEILRNATCNSKVGLALMFSKRLQIRGNLALNNEEHGILFRSIFDSTISGNRVEGNARGFFLNDAGRNVITANEVRGNAIGVHVTAGSDDNEVYGNTFAANPVQIRTVWKRPIPWDHEGRGNYWSDYLGWDMDHDGTGDRVYYASNRIDVLMSRYPQMRLLTFSPALQVMAALEARFPVLRQPSIVDRYPAMHPPAGVPAAGSDGWWPAEVERVCRETRRHSEGSTP